MFNKVLVAMLIVSMVGFIVYMERQPERKAAAVTPSATPEPVRLSSTVMWDTIQEWRRNNDLPEYIEDERLCKIAEDRVDDEKLDFHQGFKDKYHQGEYAISENLGKGITELGVLNGWLTSSSHREALEIPYKASCVRCLDDYCVHIMSSLDY